MKCISAGVTGVVIVWRFFSTYLVSIFVGACVFASIAAAEEEPAADSESETALVVCLHTEYLPLAKEEKGVLPFRLVRELGRQAVLIAARDELGFSTRDETLGEPFPAAVTEAGDDLQVKVRCWFDESVRIALSKTGADSEKADAEIGAPADLPDKYNTYLILLRLTKSLEAMSRGDLVERLRELGFAGEAAAVNEENLPPQAVNDLLLDMNFVSQFAAVRAAHAAIAEKGPSAAWLGVLARGYAHLALMTQHHWKSDNEVFAARALLYAERLARADMNNRLSRATRAYVRAIVGLHGAALREMEKVEELRGEGDGDDAASLPRWVDFVVPYCSFEREPVAEIGRRRPSLSPLAQRLSFEQTRAFGDDRWLYQAATEAVGACPEEYGIYATLANPRAPLGVGRMGAYYGPAALHRLLPPRIAQLDGLPGPVRSVLGGAAEDAAGEESGEPSDDEDNEQDAGAVAEEDAAKNAEKGQKSVPTEIARQLISVCEGDADGGEPSWSVLGNLIAEEQFVQAANYLKISMNATESSMEEVVAAMLPTIEGHRYARHVEAYRVNWSRDTARFYEILGDMQIVDPRGNMAAMFTQTWRAYDQEGQERRGRTASWAAFSGRNLTFPGMLESYDQLGGTWWGSVDEGMKRVWANDFGRISPHSPQALRLEMQNAAKPDYEKAAEWEARAGEDPQAHRLIGTIYAGLEHYEDAIRCFEASIGLSPSRQSFVDLANAYRAGGQDEMWLPTLERFFEVESMGLDHGQMHKLIAEDWITKGNWKEAEAHALGAAETWSAWGLLLAADVTEVLEKWEDSEKWVREASTNYPTYSGHEWYFWCRRIGRGDVKEARKTAQKYFAADWIKTNDEGRHRSLMFNTMEDNLPAALEDAKYLSERYLHPEATMQNRLYHHLMLSLTARETEEKEIERETLDKVRTIVKESREEDPDLLHVDEFVCRLFDGEAPSDEEWTAMDEHLIADAIPRMRRCNREYIIGRLCELNGDAEHAEAFYRRAIAASHDNRLTSTLAGMRLAERAEAAE